MDAIEGMARFPREIEDAEPGLGDEFSTVRLFFDVGERFGQDVHAKALAWIRSRRKGETFHRVRLYSVADDLADALDAVTGEKSAVDELFGR